MPLQGAFSCDPASGISEQFISVTAAMGGAVMLNGAMAIAVDWPERPNAAKAIRKRLNSRTTRCSLRPTIRKVKSRLARCLSLPLG